jgi:PAS domain S-box-containing protein
MTNIKDLKILIIDDLDENLISLKATLEVNGFVVETANSGQKGLYLLLKDNFGLVLLDVQMPEMDGFEVLEHMKGNSRTKLIPVIFLTAVAIQKEYFFKGLEIGAVDYITKPLDVKLLLIKVMNFLTLSHSELSLKKAKNELTSLNKQLQIKYKSILENMNDAFVLRDLSGKILFANKRFYELLGVQTENVLPLSLEDFITTDSLPVFNDNYARCTEGAFVNDFECQGKKKDNTIIWLEFHITAVFEKNVICGTQSIIRNITQRRKDEEERKKLMELNNKIIESSNQLFYIIKVENTQSFQNPFIYLSNNAVDFCGLNRKDIFQNNHSWVHFIHPEDVNYVLKKTQLIYKEKKPTTLVYRRKNNLTNDYFWVYDYVFPVLNTVEDVVELYGSMKNVTELKNKESEIIEINRNLIKIEENERVRIAYEIHDGLMQTLAAISMHIDKIKTANEFEDLRLLIKSAIWEAKNITNDLFPKDLHENGLIKSISIIAENLSKTKEIEVTIDSSENFNQVLLSEHMQFNIYRIVQESLNNTIKHAFATKVTIQFFIKNKSLVILYSNNGTAINKEILHKPTSFASIKRRINIMNGTFEITKNLPENVVFKYTFPLETNDVFTL